MTTLSNATMDVGRMERFAEKVGTDQNIAVAGLLAYIGDRLGIWGSLAGAGWVAPATAAESTGLDPTYLGEWMAALAAAGYLEYDTGTGTFLLPPEHAAVLADDDSPAAQAGGFEFLAGAWADADRVADLFVAGGGIAWADRDERLLNGAARFFRPLYRSSLLSTWLPALGDVVDRLEKGARVLDVGCGRGLPTMLMAEAFPNSAFVGIDPDETAVADAGQSAARAGLGNVTFHVATAVDAPDGGWDLVCYFDAFHHVGDPVAAAAAARRRLSPSGTILVVEPRSEDTLEANIAGPGTLYLGPSTLLCLPDAMAQSTAAPLGAQAGPSRLLHLLAEAGFTNARVAATTDFNLVIDARP